MENGSDTTPLPVLDIFEKVKLWKERCVEAMENGSDTTPLPVLDIFEKVKLW